MAIDWEKVPHFERREFDDPNYTGSGDCINGGLLIMLVKLRNATDWPIIPHWKVGGAVDIDGSHGHSNNSYHLKSQGCEAVDFHFVTDIDPRLQVYNVLQLGFGGIGIYYDWKWDNKPLSIGFHVDVRPKGRFQIWKREDGQYIYLLR